MTTIYEHNSKELYRDENDEYEIEEIRTHFAEFNKELVTATYTVIPPKKEGDPRKVIFAKTTGTLGAGTLSTSTDILINLILDLPPAKISAITLLDEFLKSGNPPDPANLVLMLDEIGWAIVRANQISDTSRQIVERCLELQPISHSDPDWI